MTDVERALARVRGAVPPLTHNARTIAALTSNPGCSRRALLDAAGVNKQRIATHVGFPVAAGQSQFAITRGNAFEAQVKADGCAELLRLLREKLNLPVADAAYADLDRTTGARDDSLAARHARTRELIGQAAAAGGEAGALFDHPMLRVDVGDRAAYLEPDLVAFQVAGRFHVVEIKSFAIIDGQADGGKVAAAVTQAAVYVLALRQLLADLGYGPERVADEVVLVCPENFSNRPTAVLVDVRRQLTVLRRQLGRLTRIETILAAAPTDLSFDLAVDAAGVARRPAAEVLAGLATVPSRYAPECLDTCELAYACRHEAGDDTAALGRSVRDDLGGIDSVTVALDLATGAREPDADQVEATRLLRAASRLRNEATAGNT